jgi:integrase
VRVHLFQDIDAAKVRGAIAALREDRKRADASMEQGISARTANFYLQALKSFARWAVKERRTIDSAVVCLDPINEMAVRREARHERRALTADELRALLRPRLARRFDSA